MALNKNAKKWVKALRSRKYKQTKGVLRNEDGFCCLGVACELAVKAKVIALALKNFSYGGITTHLPEPVRNWLGLNHISAQYRTPKLGVTDLTADNDDRKKKFYQIARIIESDPQGMFS